MYLPKLLGVSPNNNSNEVGSGGAAVNFESEDHRPSSWEPPTGPTEVAGRSFSAPPRSQNQQPRTTMNSKESYCVKVDVYLTGGMTESVPAVHAWNAELVRDVFTGHIGEIYAVAATFPGQAFLFFGSDQNGLSQEEADVKVQQCQRLTNWIGKVARCQAQACLTSDARTAINSLDRCVRPQAIRPTDHLITPIPADWSDDEELVGNVPDAGPEDAAGLGAAPVTSKKKTKSAPKKEKEKVLTKKKNSPGRVFESDLDDAAELQVRSNRTIVPTLAEPLFTESDATASTVTRD